MTYSCVSSESVHQPPPKQRRLPTSKVEGIWRDLPFGRETKGICEYLS